VPLIWPLFSPRKSETFWVEKPAKNRGIRLEISNKIQHKCNYIALICYKQYIINYLNLLNKCLYYLQSFNLKSPKYANSFIKKLEFLIILLVLLWWGLCLAAKAARRRPRFSDKISTLST
jgi:hypothetical protein